MLMLIVDWARNTGAHLPQALGSVSWQKKKRVLTHYTSKNSIIYNYLSFKIPSRGSPITKNNS